MILSLIELAIQPAALLNDLREKIQFISLVVREGRIVLMSTTPLPPMLRIFKGGEIMYIKTAEKTDNT